MNFVLILVQTQFCITFAAMITADNISQLAGRLEALRGYL